MLHLPGRGQKDKPQHGPDESFSFRASLSLLCLIQVETDVTAGMLGVSVGSNPGSEHYV